MSTEHFLHLITTSVIFAGYRRRYCTVGWSQKSVWRTSRGLWSCLQRARESPALPATLATTTAMTPPVCPAHPEPTQMAPTVNLHTPAHTWHISLSRHWCCIHKFKLFNLYLVRKVVHFLFI